MKPNALFTTLTILFVACAATIAGSGAAADGFSISSSVGGSPVAKGMTVSGSVAWSADPSSTPVKVEFLIDGSVKWTESVSPYVFNGDGGRLDTTSLADGTHKLAVRAYRPDGKVKKASVRVVVANGVAKPHQHPPPPPPPPPSTFTVASNIADGGTLAGSLEWSAAASGASVSRVEFLVDGVLKWTENVSPYVFNGDGHRLDTTTLANGAHTLTVQAYATDGRSVTAASSVTVSNATVPPYVVTSSLGTSATVSGTLAWTAAPSGATTSRVDFVVDGTVNWSDTSAPYGYNGDAGQLDTTTLTNGAHSLAVRAYATDGRTATASSSVTVANTPLAQAPAVSGTVPAPNGTAVVGQVLTALTGTWSGTQPITYAYQWQRCLTTCGDVGGATGSTYALASADAGATVRVRVTATNLAGSASATGASTPTVATAPVPPQGGDWASFVGVDAYRTTDFAQIAASGIKRVRMDNPGVSTFAAAQSNGIDVLPIADYEPWPDLNGGKGDKYPPLPASYKTWSDRILAQWQSLPKPPTAIEVWNEPWLSSFWQPTPDPVAYYNLVRVFATEAWQIWPKVKILVAADTVGSTNTTGTIYWRQNLLAADTDGFLNDPRIEPTTHNYVGSVSPTNVTSKPCWWDIDRFECAYDDFRAHGNPDPQVWVTEYGWESGTVGEQNQASYLTQALSIFKSSGKVAAAYSYFFKSNESVTYNWLRPDNSPKPVVAAVKSLTTG